jgi:hypothetical protein
MVMSKAYFPLSEFVRAKSKKAGTDPTFRGDFFRRPTTLPRFVFRFGRTNSPGGKWALI